MLTKIKYLYHLINSSYHSSYHSRLRGHLNSYEIQQVSVSFVLLLLFFHVVPLTAAQNYFICGMINDTWVNTAIFPIFKNDRLMGKHLKYFEAACKFLSEK